MEIGKIDDLKKTLLNDDVELHKNMGRPCIYYAEQQCSVPNLKFKICQQCPRACQFIRKNVVRSVFDHVKSLAIMLLNHVGVGGPGGSAGGGGGGAGGAGGGGAGGGGGGGGGGG